VDALLCPGVLEEDFLLEAVAAADFCCFFSEEVVCSEGEASCDFAAKFAGNNPHSRHSSIVRRAILVRVLLMMNSFPGR
jgi:hypothetical protein